MRGRLVNVQVGQLRGLIEGHPSDAWGRMVETMRDGSEDWAVIVGAGLSAGAGLPTWFRLANGAMVATKGVELPEGATALATALEECEQADPTAFWSFVQTKVCAPASPTRAQELVCGLPFQCFVTLNYDRLLEEPWAAATGLGESDVMSYPSLKTVHMAGRRLVYLHGRCPGCTGGSMSSANTVLTHGSYLSAYEPETTLATAVRALFLDYNVLIVGSSLSDPDLGYILRSLARAKARGSTSPRQHLALVQTDAQRHQDSLRYQFPPLENGVEPLFYHAANGDHSQLEVALSSFARLVEQP